MGRQTWRIRCSFLVSAAALFVGPPLVSSQGTASGAPQVNPAIPAPSGVVLVSLKAPRAPRRLADMVMPVPADNPLTEAKAALGRKLFFDPLLSNDRSVSCSTCHDPARAFADERTLAVGVFGRVGRRHSPTLINRGFGRAQFWDGRAGTLEAQVLQPITDPNEMDLSIEDTVKRLTADASYRAAFQTAFERPISAEDLGRALASYLRTIRSGDSPYDRFIAGAQDALTPEQQHGLQIFRTKGRCGICHTEPTFTNEQFQNTGVAWRIDPGGATGTYQDDGRFAVSGLERDRGKFKTPTLREIARTAPYMHDGSLATLADVIEFYDKGGRPNRNLFPAVRPLGLLPEEKLALLEFLESLSGVVTGK
jgi:cytochrome c peroxidase